VRIPKRSGDQSCTARDDDERKAKWTRMELGSWVLFRTFWDSSGQKALRQRRADLPVSLSFD
jgi:hypothetical protein